MSRGILQSLLRYVSDHMEREEKHIRQYAFPDAASHVQEHRDFGNALQAIIERLPDGEAAARTALPASGLDPAPYSGQRPSAVRARPAKRTPDLFRILSR